jgi:hypothetical protein
MAARPYAPSATSRHGDTCGGGIQRVDGFHRSSRPRWHVSGAQHAAVVDAAFLSRGTWQPWCTLDRAARRDRDKRSWFAQTCRNSPRLHRQSSCESLLHRHACLAPHAAAELPVPHTWLWVHPPTLLASPFCPPGWPSSTFVRALSQTFCVRALRFACPCPAVARRSSQSPVDVLGGICPHQPAPAPAFEQCQRSHL